MNQKFLELSEEKRLAIINAGLEVFSKYDYKHALTDDIAAKAGISKGLLFYYFHNKLELYNYLAENSVEIILKHIEELKIIDGWDFFEALKLAVDVKTDMLNSYPYIYGFAIKYYQSRKELDGHSYEKIAEEVLGSYDLIKRSDVSKFKENVDPQEVWKIIYWMSEGYMDAFKDLTDIDIDAIKAEYFRYLDILKENFYREECL